MTTLIQIESKKLQKMLKKHPFMSEGTVELVTKSNNESFKEWLQQKQQFAIKGDYRPEMRVYKELLEEL